MRGRGTGIGIAVLIGMSAGVAPAALAQTCDFERDPEMVAFDSPGLFFIDTPLGAQRGNVQAFLASDGCTVSLTEQTRSLPLLFTVESKANDGSAVFYIANDTGEEGVCLDTLKAGNKCLVVGNAVFEGPEMGAPAREMRTARTIRTTVTAIITLLPQPGAVEGQGK